MTKTKRLRRALLISSILVAPVLAYLAWAGSLYYIHARNTTVGPMHSFQLDATRPFLSDTLAVEKAKEALALDGYDLAEWRPREDRRGTAPDGTPDVYLARNTNPNMGSIAFELRSGATQPHIYVAIELTGDRVQCQVFYYKWRL
jgi:hypothetical protein